MVLAFHGGSTGTACARFPDEGLCVIVLTNLEATAGSAAETLALNIANGYRVSGASLAK